MPRVIDWLQLSIPGTCVGWTDTLDVVGAAIRTGEAGPSAALDSRIPSHVSISWPRDSGTLTMLEMNLQDGIRRFDQIGMCSESKWSDHIVFVAVPPCLIDNEDLQRASCMWFQNRLDEHIPYPLRNLTRFLTDDKRPVEKLPVCSMLYVLYLQWLQPIVKDFEIPEGWTIDDYPALVSPLDLMKWFAQVGWLRTFTKWESEDYGKTKTEILAKD
jgi:hypothetical protein